MQWIDYDNKKSHQLINEIMFDKYLFSKKAFFLVYSKRSPSSANSSTKNYSVSVNYESKSLTIFECCNYESI